MFSKVGYLLIGIGIAFLQGFVMVWAVLVPTQHLDAFDLVAMPNRIFFLILLNAIYCVLLVLRSMHQRKIKKSTHNHFVNCTIKSLIIFAAFSYLLMLDIILLVDSITIFSWYLYLGLFLSGTLFLVLYCAVELFDTNQIVERPTLEIAHSEFSEPIDCISTNIKYGNNRLPDFIKDVLLVSLKDLMVKTEPWLCAELTLKDLADQLSVAPHQLSQVINLEYGVSFQTYINRYRIEHACKLLRQKASALSVLDVAIISGFSSKSTFNAIFRKEKSSTPSEYRTNLLLDCKLLESKTA